MSQTALEAQWKRAGAPAVSVRPYLNHPRVPPCSLQRENLLRGQQEEEERLLSAIPLFCFPDGNEWAPLTEYPR